MSIESRDFSYQLVEIGMAIHREDRDDLKNKINDLVNDNEFKNLASPEAMFDLKNRCKILNSADSSLDTLGLAQEIYTMASEIIMPPSSETLPPPPQFEDDGGAFATNVIRPEEFVIDHSTQDMEFDPIIGEFTVKDKMDVEEREKSKSKEEIDNSNPLKEINKMSEKDRIAFLNSGEEIEFNEETGEFKPKAKG